MSVKRRRRRRADERSSSSQQGWMATYGDMVTLILAFFVMMFAFSHLDIERFRAIMSAFQGSIGVMDSGRTISDEGAVAGATTSRPEMLRHHVQDDVLARTIVHNLVQLRQSEQSDPLFTVETAERGIIVHFTEGVLFDLGQASLKPEGIGLLHDIFDILKEWPYHIRVEGHTDDWPIGTIRYPSNWELSTARAARVVRFAIDERRWPPERLSAAGYGKYRPVADNTTPEGRSKNRRVDIVLLNDMQSQREPISKFDQ